jgi:hypothetical protein
LEHKLDDLRGVVGHVKLTVQLEQPLPGLKDRIYNGVKSWWNPDQLFALEVEVKNREVQEAMAVTQEQSPLEAYRSFYLERRGQELPLDLEQAFTGLLEESTVLPTQ